MAIIRRNLPHLDLGCMDYFVTYRQAGTWKANEGPRKTEPVLCKSEVAGVIMDSWKLLGGEKIDLHALCIMPDHVHVVLTPRPGNTISKLLYSHKRFTGARINLLLERTGPFWQEESFDRIIRDGKFGAAIENAI